MGNLNLTLLPPQNWQDFEKLVKGIVDVIWKQDGWQNYGRPGQGQTGIDLYGYDNNNKFTGLQCKRKKLTDSDGLLLTSSLLTEKLIKKEIESAEKIANPSLERFIFATTSSRDAKIQDVVKNINHGRIKSNNFSVEIWFWEDLQVHIENHIELMNWYYHDVLEKISKYDKNIHILTLLRQAFSRPAFSREIRVEESGADFIHAIKDTQEAIMTGKLYNRRGDLLATSFQYHKLNKEEWKRKMKIIYNKLDEIRIIYQKGLVNNGIREHPTCLEFLDVNISEKFNRIRKDCLIIFNEVLADVGLDLIDSELLNT